MCKMVLIKVSTILGSQTYMNTHTYMLYSPYNGAWYI